MKKYLALYMASPEAMARWATMSEADQAEGMKAWQTWMDVHASEFVDMGTPLGGNIRITKAGATPTKNAVGGYSVVQAESPEAAAAIFADSPHFDGGEGLYIELMPFGEMK